MRKLIVSAYESFLVILSVLVLIIGATIGFNLGRGRAYYSNSFGLTDSNMLGLFIGLFAGFVFDVVVFGFLFQISSIRNDISDLKAKFAPEDSNSLMEDSSIKKTKRANKDNEKTNTISDSPIDLSEDQKFECPNCGKEISISDKKCPYCNKKNEAYGAQV